MRFKTTRGDGLGTTQLASTVGAVTDSYAYDVFGGPRTTTGTTANEFRFTGEQTDLNAARELLYLRARHYDPALGRFLQQDPLPFMQRYAYVGNNPANYVDPTGLCWICDKGADLKDWGTDVANHPNSVIEISIGTGVALTSTGDRRRVDGVTIYENCRGTCSVPFAGGATAITLGHSIFGRAKVSEGLLLHELEHVRQGDRFGRLWIPAYLLEQLRVSPRCRLNFECYERTNRFEVEATRAEDGKK